MKFPEKIYFITDDLYANLVTVKTHSGKGERLKQQIAVYIYQKRKKKLKSKITGKVIESTKVGMEIPLTIEEILFTQSRSIINF